MNTIVLVGFGSIAKRHIRNLKQLDPTLKIVVLREHSKNKDLGEYSSLVEALVFTRDDALNFKPDAAIIAHPAPFHVSTALACVEQGVHVFIEKPLSHGNEGVEALLNACRKRNVTAMVGYVLRFDPLLKLLKSSLDRGLIGKPLSLRAEVGQYLPSWREGMDYRNSVSAKEELGGGAILELSHEIDYARWLMGDVAEVTAQASRLSDLDIDVEDVAEMSLRFSSGAMGQIHMDMLQRPPHRSCKVIGSEGTIVWDGINATLHMWRASHGTWENLHEARTFDRNEKYLDELRHFFRCIEEGHEPMISLEDAQQTLSIALLAKQSAKEGRTLKIL